MTPIPAGIARKNKKSTLFFPNKTAINHKIIQPADAGRLRVLTSKNMEIISEINFPILKYIGTREIFAHKDFKPFFRKLDLNNLTRREKEETKNVDWSKQNVYQAIKSSSETRKKWPILAVDRETCQLLPFKERELAVSP